MPLRFSLAILFLLGLLHIVVAAEPPQTKTTLFDGKTLQGWHVTGCKAGVEDGLLVIQEGNGFVRADHRYRDFILQLSWKPRQKDKYDAGVYIRASLPPSGKPWPDRYQVNLKNGDEANLIGFKTAKSSGLVKPGEWNQMRLTVIGDTASMELNGKPAWKTTGVEQREGYVGLQVEVPGGGQFEFKDISITEIGYQSLFNGKDLTGWEGADADAAKCWRVEEGTLLCTGAAGPWLRSKEQYENYNLRLTYKLKAGGNSGVYVRVPKDGDHHGEGAGIEVQILDDKAERYATLMPYQYSGSLYAIVPAEPRVTRSAGEWNTLEIDCHDKNYIVVQNGIQVIKASAKDFPELEKRLGKGYIGLQNHSEEVWFRDLRIGPSTQESADKK